MWLLTLSSNEILGLILVFSVVTVFGTYWTNKFFPKGMN